MRITPLALLVAILLLPVAAAQLPTPLQPCGPITLVEPTPPSEPVANGEEAEVAVSAQMGGQLGGTIAVTASTVSPGWSVTAVDDEQTVGAGNTVTFRFLVRAGDEAASDADVQFAASGTCDSGPAPCPGNACVPAGANTQVLVPYEPGQGLAIPGLDDLAFPVEYLIAAIVLVGLATAIPFAMKRSRGGVVADCPEPLKMVKPGLGTSFPIEVRNAAREASTTQLEVGPVPEGWSAFMPLPEVQLAAHEARSLWLMVRSPPQATNGESVDVEVRLKDNAGHSIGLVRVRAEVQGADA